jgi:valyl-tRNA synthetase
MDEGLSRAVRKVFVELYRAGLIYKDKRLVNWDPKLGTAISDLEVQQVEVKGHLWHIRYPLAGTRFDPNDPSTFITVATTRPETMLGDVAVAVHPDDERYRHLVGKEAVLPLVGRRIPIIADEYSDPEKGTGAVKITPAHDFNDFEVWQRHKDRELAGTRLINIFDPEAKLYLVLNQEFRAGVPASAEMAETLKLSGADRFKARDEIVARLEALGLLEKVETHSHKVPHGDRSNEVIEPFLTEQWYVDAKKLAQPAIDAVRNGDTTFVPKHWDKTYFDWMEKIQPWCISRQLWWGHQIPAWYGPSKLPRINEQGSTLDLDERHVFVAHSEEEAIAQAQQYYGRPATILPSWIDLIRAWESNVNFGAIPIARDEDVLDTWFSSALWPFSTLGWPDETPELKRYYPTDALVTGFDIIFFWVARMMMMGMHFTGKVPFHTVYIHALVRDARGAKMSKSKGNVIDPLELIDAYGADALRFTLAAMAAQGRDIKLSTQRVEGYRNFATKLWNAARFAEINRCVRVASFEPKNVNEKLNLWILGETERTIHQVTTSLEGYKFNEAANAIYHFVWSVFCDWYLEFSKSLLTGGHREAKKETRATVAFVLDQILKLLHPFMPFITEELWRVTGEKGPKRNTLLALAPWPHFKVPPHRKAGNEIGKQLDLISTLRSMRSELNVPPGVRVPLTIITRKEPEWVKLGREAIKRLAQISDIMFRSSVPIGAVQIIMRNSRAALQLADVINYSVESARLETELVKISDEIARIDQKLGNKSFVEKAPEEVVEEQRERREKTEDRKTKLQGAIEQLKRVLAVPSRTLHWLHRSKKRAKPRRKAGSDARGVRRARVLRTASKKKAAMNRKVTRKKARSRKNRRSRSSSRRAR